jgi:hypothetical protein
MLLDMQSVVESSKEEILHNLSERERTALMRLLRRLIGADKPPVPAKISAKPPARLKKSARSV